MIALFLAPLYLGLLILIFIKSIKYFKHRKKVTATFFTCLSALVLIVTPLTIAVGFLLPSGNLKRVFTVIGNYWLGISLYLLISVGICDLFRLLFKKILKDKYNDFLAKNISNVIVVIFTICMSLYGIFNAHNLKVTYYDVNSNKQSAVSDLNIVLISDLHLGYNIGVNEMTNMVNKINALNPDIVLLAGDVFDNEFEAIDKPKEIENILKGISSKYGKFAVYGNHDIEEKILCGFTFSSGEKKKEALSTKQMDDFIENSGFEVLYDNYIKINNEKGETITYVYGRPDYEKPNFGNITRLNPEQIMYGMNSENYIICLDHEPRELNELAKAGVDLDLNGHTHNGQIWPGTLTIKLFWDNAYGMLQVDNMVDIVTSGVGLFGPNMRTGCVAEIANIFVHFK